ncbi:hypothetical protein [Salinibacter altiplanensis]|uniref:hypothetical protein n=1 Tax=Salinibacter altiplanensis TaxID=1803181 RepID=UPI00131A56D6|nr:hypothetical protein [Salinibacter altiplanensis]
MESTIQQVWTVFEGGLAALLATAVLTPLVIRAAHTFGWVDRPSDDRWHERPTALMGGIALFGGISVGLLWSAPGAAVLPFWGGAALLFAMGLVDDLWHVPPSGKLTVQGAAAGLLLYSGYAFGPAWPVWVSTPLTLLWVVGMTNSINLLDNMDGLAAGIAGIAAAAFGALAVGAGALTAGVLAATVAGAAVGFLGFNAKPARIFMGDCGSLALGFLLAGLGLAVQAEMPAGDPVAVALVPLAVLAVPILDTTLVTVMRRVAERSVAQGGNDHASHRLVLLGLSERRAVWMLYGLGLLSGAGALLVLVADPALFYAVAGLGGVGLGVLGIHLARARVYDEEAPALPRTALARRPFRALHRLAGPHWKAVVGVLGDALIVGAAFVGAHVLRHGGSLPGGVEGFVLGALPLVVAAKAVVFYAGGLYRGLWRHAGTPELLRTVATTSAASALVAVLLMGLYSAAAVPAAALVIDWMITTGGVAGARFGFRGLRQYLISCRPGARRVLIYGADDTGLLALRTLRHDRERPAEPVGFVDDDPLTEGQTVQGLRVLGARADLPRLCRAHDIDELLIATDAHVPERRRVLAEACRKAGIDCRAFTVSYASVSPEEDTAPEPSPSAAPVGMSKNGTPTNGTPTSGVPTNGTSKNGESPKGPPPSGQ